MKNALLLLLLGLFPLSLMAQKPYFQQKVEYKIDVTLDDYRNQLKGQLELTYYNQSPDDLSFIYFHLWPNAYSNRKTAFAKQMIEFDSLRFYFAPDEDLGRITGLDFAVNGQKASFKLDKDNPDIGKLELDNPLRSGASITITTPFVVDIPVSFSRMGHVGQSYQITQWYPKPAVYDNEGWHAMPYLSLGEFYSEFGSFDVSITLPENYVVAATGTLQTDSEKLFLQERIKQTEAYFDTLSNPVRGIVEEDFPSTIATQKTIRFTAENVHDFAWFADKRFKVLEKIITLPTGEEVACRAFFDKSNEKQWQHAPDFIARAVKFYSANVGAYPYPHATAVSSVHSLGGGMEYPMITLIGPSGSDKGLDNVITHEVGHNWFYGILGSNERDHAWMDEGLNTYYERKYMRKYYEGNGMDFFPRFLYNGSDYSIEELVFLFKARKNRHQAIDLRANQMSPVNYFINAYSRPAKLMDMLEKYVGTDALDKAMKDYYRQWKYRHPKPHDFNIVLESNLHKNLKWLFDESIESRKTMDYAFSAIAKKDAKVHLKVRNKGGIDAPFSITGFRQKGVQLDTLDYPWQEGFMDVREIVLPDDGADYYTIDAVNLSNDINRANNHIKSKGLFKRLEPIRLKFLTGLENDKVSTLFFSPMFSWNAYDNSMLGLYLGNTPLFSNRPFEYRLLPLYAFGSRSISGEGMAQYRILPRNSRIDEIKIGLNARKFSADYNMIFDVHLGYKKFTPFIELTSNPNHKKPIVHTLRLQNVILQTEHLVFKSGDYVGKTQYLQYFPQLIYKYKNNRALHPSALTFKLEYGQDTVFFLSQQSLKAAVTYHKAYTYAPKKSIDFRFHIGAFLKNTQGKTSVRYPNSLTLAGYNAGDYLYDEYYFGRNEYDNIWAQQIGTTGGGMRYSVGQNHPYGYSNKFIATINITADLPQSLPLNLPLRPFFDIGYFATPEKPLKLSDNILWVAGIELELLPDILEVYFPVIESSRIKNNYAERGNYLSRISFLINLNKANPWKEVENYLPW